MANENNKIGPNSFVLNNVGDLTSSNDITSVTYRNSIGYSLNPTGAGHSNNGMFMHLSSYGMGGTSDDETNSRDAQLYFGDTPSSGLYYRVKQGTLGWHKWVSLSAGIKKVHYISDNVHRFTNSPDGYTTMEKTFNRDGQVNNLADTKFLIITTLNGSANDDAHAVLEFYNGTSWTNPQELRGQGNTGDTRANASFGDFSVVRAGSMEDKQTVNFTSCFLHAPNSTAATLGYRVRHSAENSNGSYLNRSMGWDNGYNSNTGISTMLILEMTGNV